MVVPRLFYSNSTTTATPQILSVTKVQPLTVSVKPMANHGKQASTAPMLLSNIHGKTVIHNSKLVC